MLWYTVTDVNITEYWLTEVLAYLIKNTVYQYRNKSHIKLYNIEFVLFNVMGTSKHKTRYWIYISEECLSIFSLSDKSKALIFISMNIFTLYW